MLGRYTIGELIFAVLGRYYRDTNCCSVRSVNCGTNTCSAMLGRSIGELIICDYLCWDGIIWYLLLGWYYCGMMILVAAAMLGRSIGEQVICDYLCLDGGMIVD